MDRGAEDIEDVSPTVMSSVISNEMFLSCRHKFSRCDLFLINSKTFEKTWLDQSCSFFSLTAKFTPGWQLSEFHWAFRVSLKQQIVTKIIIFINLDTKRWKQNCLLRSIPNLEVSGILKLKWFFPLISLTLFNLKIYSVMK